MLDLSLDHLGLITRPDKVEEGTEVPVASGLARIVEQIGEGVSASQADRGLICFRAAIVIQP